MGSSRLLDAFERVETNAILGSLLVVRWIAAIVSNIGDCDETFNYWEPTYHVLFGGGLQTWEYSPVYALRSYLYILDHAAFGWLATALGMSRVSAFYFIRLVLATKSASCEWLMVLSVRQSFGCSIGFWTWWFLLTSPGMFHASVSFLPSSFAMYFIALCWAFWSPSRENPQLAVGAVAVAAIAGWPFAALIGAPLAFELVTRRVGPSFVRLAALAALAVAPAVFVADAAWYGRWTFSTLNMLRYNLLPRGVGSELYGTEPLWFYARNLALNWNLALPLAALALPVVVAAPRLLPPLSVRAAPRLRLMTMAALLWVCAFSLLPHKEERFMFVAYPPLALAAAVGANAIVRALSLASGGGGGSSSSSSRPGARASSSPSGAALLLCLAVLAGSGALSAMRIGAVVGYYSAPLSLFTSLSREGGLPPLGRGVTVSTAPRTPGTLCDAPYRLCVGGEWHRFPSSWLLPRDTCLSFVRSDFRGILPQPFARTNGTRAVPAHMNERNLEETSRYVPLSACHYFVELEAPDDPGRLSQRREWQVARRLPFLDAGRSPALTRALWIPWLSARWNVYKSYVLLVRVR